MRLLGLGFIGVAGLVACAGPPAYVGSAPHPRTHSARPTPCARALSDAEALRQRGFWLRAARRLEAALPSCDAREDHQAALVEVVIALADVTAAERLVAQVGPEHALRLRTWLQTEARKRSGADIGDQLRALRALRARRDPAALAAAEAAVERAGARGELLAEVGLARLASEGPRAAQPDFDRARVALERETRHPASAFTLASALPEFEALSWTPDARELWLMGGGSRPSAAMLDSDTWEPVWQLSGDSRSYSWVPLANGAGFARRDGIFARDGRRLFDYRRWTRARRCRWLR